MPRSRRCNPSYVVRQPVILQCVDILFHHYQLLAAVSMIESVRTHTHRISKSTLQLATAVHGSGMCMSRLTAQICSVWAKLHAIDQLLNPSNIQPLHSVYGRHVAYRLAEVPTDSTLERVEAGIPHPPCRLELNSSRVIIEVSDYLVASDDN